MHNSIINFDCIGRVIVANMADKLGILNVEEWIEEHQSSFVPPVCNKLM